jgi:hypothetical protein
MVTRLGSTCATRLLLLPLLLLLALPSVVPAQFSYTTTNGTITITGYTGPGGDVTIPDTIGGLPVASIGDWAFYGSSLTSVTIPDTVANIGNYAFGACTSLTSITIPYRVTIIGNSAFNQCTSLTNAVIGKNVRIIGSTAFQNCTSLTAITVDLQNTYYSSVAGVLFNQRQTMLIQYPGGKAAGYTVPDSATSIGNDAFSDCANLTSLTIPDSVTNIGDRAFSSCLSLTSVTVGKSVNSIGGGAFQNCTGLTAITVDAANSVYSSVAGVLFNKSQTTLIQYPGGKLGDYVIPNTVISLGDAAFQGCDRLTGVTIPDSVTTIGGSAFASCHSLTGLTIPNSVTSIGVMAFDGCISLSRVTIGNSVASIGDWAFYGSSLTSVTIPDSVTSIGDDAFDACSSLTSVTIGTNVATIGNHAFWDCSNLASVTIPDSVTSIGVAAFERCFSLTSVTLGTNVTSIENAAFQYCGSLSRVTIPNRVTSIGSWAFGYCTNLAVVYFEGNAPSLGAYVFQGDNHATAYYLPGTTGWGTTYVGLPTALWTQVPTLQASPQSQTAEAGSAVGLRVKASSPLPLFCFWYLNATNLLSSGTNWQLGLTNVQFFQSGAYTVVVSNVLGAVTSAPAMLNVIAPVERRPVPGIKVTGEPASLLNVDYADSLSPAPNWTTLGSVSLTSTSQYYFDLTLPLPPQRFYRAWQTGTPGLKPSLDLSLVPAITVTGSIGGSVRLDAINQFGPIDAWFTLDTVMLTNTSQLYFDTSAWRQPPRLYRLVQVP